MSGSPGAADRAAAATRRDNGRVAEQLGFEGMPRRLYPCTPYRLNTWVDCPRRYRMTYLDRPPPPKGPAWARTSLGVSIHNALAGWWRLPFRRRTAAGAGELLVQGWVDEGFRDRQQSAQWRERARDMVTRYAERLDPAEEPLGVERTVATRTNAVAVSGRIDRLDLRRGEAGEELVVVDYKTGRHLLRPDDARGSMALALYALAATRVMRRPCRRVELHHLPSGEVVAWEHTEESLARQLRRAEDIARECAEADAAFTGGLPADRYEEVFPPRVGPGCAWCDFARHCPEGSAAYPTRRPWDGLAD